jgi:hypothetical protein
VAPPDQPAPAAQGAHRLGSAGNQAHDTGVWFRRHQSIATQFDAKTAVTSPATPDLIALSMVVARTQRIIAESDDSRTEATCRQLRA